MWWLCVGCCGCGLLPAATAGRGAAVGGGRCVVCRWASSLPVNLARGPSWLPPAWGRPGPAPLLRVHERGAAATVAWGRLAG